MKRFACFLLLALFAAPVHAEVKLPPAFSSHMVLQRDAAVPIWGTASPEEEVAVSIGKQTKTTKADAQGQWRVALDPLAVGDPLTLTVKGKNTLEIADVLVGEVWLGSGQSNMDGRVKGYAPNDPVLAEAAKGTYPQLRLLHTSGGSGWQEATPANNENFSAILFAFGLRLQQELKVPVGIMLGAVGGTPSGYWLTEEMYKSDAACQEQVKQFAATYDFNAEMKKYESEMVAWKTAAEAAKQKNEKPPRAPEKPVQAGEVSGGKMGYLYESKLRPVVSYGIRGVLWDQGESGTRINGVDQFNVMGALIKGWRKDWNQGDFPFLYVQKPSGNGCAWDPADPITRLASPFAAPPAAVPASKDGAYRELHIRIAKHPNTAMVISSDLGSGIHPANKSGYGYRAARTALGMVYGKKVEFAGPTVESHAVEGDKVRLKFTHVGQGLAARHAEKLQGFAIAGEDKKFVWADAAIDGDTIVVSSPQVPAPKAVRYAWGGNHPWANLFNKDGLPAQTFRTDNW